MDFVSFISLWIVQTESKHKINKTRSELLQKKLWHVGRGWFEKPYTYCNWGLRGIFHSWLIKVNNLTEFWKCLI